MTILFTVHNNKMALYCEPFEMVAFMLVKGAFIQGTGSYPSLRWTKPESLPFFGCCIPLTGLVYPYE